MLYTTLAAVCQTPQVAPGQSSGTLADLPEAAAGGAGAAGSFSGLCWLPAAGSQKVPAMPSASGARKSERETERL